MAAYLRFGEEDKKIEYIFKGGNKNWTHYNNEQFPEIPLNVALQWASDVGNHKNITFQSQIIDDSKKVDVEKVFNNNVICYFPPDRYEKPNWLQDDYHNISEFEHLGLGEKYTGNLYTPITVFNPMNDNIRWLLDVIVDSRAEVIQNGIRVDQSGKPILIDGKLQYNYAYAPRFNQGNLTPLLNARLNVEQILSDILGKQVGFELNMRDVKTSGRFRIVEKVTGNIIIPTFDSLSTGQMALFNLFATIIRYADYNDVNKSIKLHDISGIVVVDEVELHLHSSLQRDILPKLLKRFPKVQFIITSHAPLFVLGMEEQFGSDGYELYQIPDGRKIGAEMFSEFQKAYEYLKQTQLHRNELSSAIENLQEKPLVVTEGATDWKHIKAALFALKKDDKNNDIFENLEFDFLEYEPKNSKVEYPLKLEMSNSHLLTMCENYAKIPQKRKIIFIADNDDDKYTVKFGKYENDLNYMNWGNNVFSLTLPVPEIRKDTPGICIEHLYTDDEIMTEFVDTDGVKRRLYIGKEFDSSGIGEGYFCKDQNSCGDDKINIIDGTEKRRVSPLKKDSKENLALDKEKNGIYGLRFHKTGARFRQNRVCADA
jgi:hypothetical protein